MALVRPSAKFSDITFFYARKREFCSEARSAAEHLAMLTGLSIRDYPDRLFNRQAPSDGDVGNQ